MVGSHLGTIFFRFMLGVHPASESDSGFQSSFLSTSKRFPSDTAFVPTLNASGPQGDADGPLATAHVVSAVSQVSASLSQCPALYMVREPPSPRSRSCLPGLAALNPSSQFPSHASSLSAPLCRLQSCVTFYLCENRWATKFNFYLGLQSDPGAPGTAQAEQVPRPLGTPSSHADCPAGPACVCGSHRPLLQGLALPLSAAPRAPDPVRR